VEQAASLFGAVGLLVVERPAVRAFRHDVAEQHGEVALAAARVRGAAPT
jgi:hypothetical protein